MGVEELLLLSRSDVWSDRMNAGRELSAFAGTAEVDGELRRLLLDPDNTAVTDATARALLRGDVAALRIFAAAWVLADPETSDHLYGCLSEYLYELSCATSEGRVRYRTTLRQLLAAPEQAVQAGARELLDLAARALPS